MLTPAKAGYPQGHFPRIFLGFGNILLESIPRRVLPDGQNKGPRSYPGKRDKVVPAVGYIWFYEGASIRTERPPYKRRQKKDKCCSKKNECKGPVGYLKDIPSEQHHGLPQGILH